MTSAPTPAPAPSPADGPLVPVTRIERWLTPVKHYMRVEATSGIVLVVCAVAALVLANSPLAEDYAALWTTKVAFVFGDFQIVGKLGHLVINDGLMTLFFFVVGLEVKRELVAGELRDPRKALLPIFAAAGGLLLPALVYLAFQWGRPGERGWAIPMATDIAFVVGILALFGRRVPFGLKIFLLTLAIVDDLAAVLIIALVYSDNLAWDWLLVAAAGFVVVAAFNRIGVRQVGVYVLVGAVIWLAFLESGIHPTVAGVLLGLLTPASAWIGRQTFADILADTWRRMGFENGDPKNPLTAPEAAPPDELDEELDEDIQLERVRFAARETVSPLHRLEIALHPWVAFAIMPLFAFANAGVPLETDAVTDSVALAVAAGLVLGKPLGILLMCAIAVRLGFTARPAGVTWPMLAAAGCLAGVGFTMALFINTLAFPVDDFPIQKSAGKIGTLVGSLLSAFLGSILLAHALRRAALEKTDAAPDPKP